MSDEVCSKCHNSGLVITTTWSGTNLNPIEHRHAEICDCVAGHAYGAAIEEGIRDVKAGRTRPWSEVRAELGLE